MDDCATNWSIPSVGNQEETRHQHKARRQSLAVPTISFLSLRSLSTKSLHLACATPPGESSCQLKTNGRNRAEHAGTCRRKFERRRRSFISQENTSSRKRKLVRPLKMKTAFVIGRERANHSKSKEDHNASKRFPDDPNCEVCRMIKTTRARRKNRPLRRADGIPPRTSFGELITADHNLEFSMMIKT